MKNKNITGIILAGGKSTRMGENKALLKFNGLTIIERVTNVIKSIFPKVIMITNTPEEYDFLNVTMHKDIYEYRGPLAGIQSGLTYTTSEKNFIISCDVPLLEESMIKYLINFRTEKPVAVFRADGFIHRLVGLYSKSLLPTINKLFDQKENSFNDGKQLKSKTSVLSLFEKVEVEIINAEELNIYKQHMFLNMNRPEDYIKIKSLIC